MINRNWVIYFSSEGKDLIEFLRKEDQLINNDDQIILIQMNEIVIQNK